jgi:hypothetical protein
LAAGWFASPLPTWFALDFEWWCGMPTLVFCSGFFGGFGVFPDILVVYCSGVFDWCLFDGVEVFCR